jgi:hypothetical protein
VPYDTPCDQEEASENKGDGEGDCDWAHDLAKNQEVFTRAETTGRSVGPVRSCGSLDDQQRRHEDRHPRQPHCRYQLVETRCEAKPVGD